MVDLHIHSQYSDGTYSVEHIIKTASNKHIEHISITDHNKVDAYLDNDINLLQNKYNIKITTGIEIDCMFCGKNSHILGYGIDVNNKKLKQLIDSIYNNSLKADCETIRLMQKDYNNISVDEFLDYKFDRSNGGWLFINYMLEKGLTECLLDGTKFYIKYPIDFNRITCGLKTVCDAIHSACGIAIFAHPPYLLGNDIALIIDNMKIALNDGIDGIECYHPLIENETSEALIKFCDSNNLYITSGGDSHGKFLDESKYYIGGQKHGEINFL